MAPRLKYWGWGHEGQGLSPGDRETLLRTLARFGVRGSGNAQVPPLDGISLRAPRLKPPDSLEAICTQEPYERVLHAFGQSQPDLIRIFARDFDHAPDVIAYPRDEADVAALMEWAGRSERPWSHTVAARRSWAESPPTSARVSRERSPWT